MTFTQSISTCFSKYAHFKGRASRSEYWWWFLFNFLISTITNILDMAIGISVISVIAMLVLLLPSLGVAVRRCHDTNHSGWWLLFPIYNIVLMLVPSDKGKNLYD